MARGSSNWTPRFVREPLFICLAIGFLLFSLDWLIERDTDTTIQLTKSEIEAIAEQWIDQMGREPLPEELAGLINEHTEHLMLLREARRLGLSEDDVIIERRLIQKLRFLIEDTAVIEPASTEALESFFISHRSRYDQPATIWFEHRFWSIDSTFDEADWNHFLSALNSVDDNSAIGTSFILGSEFTSVSQRSVADDFGEPFAAAVFRLSADGIWRGPLTSSYGFHLVRVRAYSPTRQVEFENVFDELRSDFDLERRDVAFQAYLDQLRQRYTIVLP